MAYTLSFAVIVLVTAPVFSQPRQVQPAAVPYKDCICEKSDEVCYCTLMVEHKLTMILEREKELVYPDEGVLKFAVGDKKGQELTEEQTQRVITADGQGSRLVIAINGTFPGPRIEAYENQTMQITVINTLHTDSVTVHFHGIHQKGSPHMDGVAFVSQCPVLPGQTFVHSFKAYPPGTGLYHAHIGDQRSMGLYGPLIIRRRVDVPNFIRLKKEIIITLQDWNHLMDAETAYHRMLTEQFDFVNLEKIDSTESVDGGLFSRFDFHSGLVNGKGRYYNSTTSHNGAPLERFKVETGSTYRFRVIGAATLYPMRVYIEGQKLELYGSDAFNLAVDNDTAVESIIIHPGERYDFLWQAPPVAPKKEILLVAETIETPNSLKMKKYHAAEAVIEFVNHAGTPNPNPTNSKTEICTTTDKCVIFNCPYLHYPPMQRKCLTFNDVKNNDPIRDPGSVLNREVTVEKFFNFGFPGVPGNTPGSVNGRQFVFPTSAYLTHPGLITRKCDECSDDDICECTYVEELEPGRLVQFVFTNIGNGSGWSHPIHLHGHSFYVMKMGFGTYDPNSGVMLNQTRDISCTDTNKYCTNMEWTNSSWSNGNVPGLNDDPPEKDTIIVPTGGYVVVRFLSDNPGAWFLHCHIDLHNTNGMGMVINEAPKHHPAAPSGFPVCASFYNNGSFVADQICGVTGLEGNIMYLVTAVVLLMVCT